MKNLCEKTARVLWVFFSVLSLAVMSVAPIVAAEEVEAEAEMWEFLSCREDEMGGPSRWCTVASPVATSRYSRVQTQIAYQCGQRDDGEKYENAVLYFNYLNLVDRLRISDGYEYHSMRFRWDKESPRGATFWHKIGGDTLYWDNDAFMRTSIRNFQEKKEFRVEANYYSEGKVVFTYSLAGAKSAIAEARAKCGLENPESEITE